MQKFKWRTLLAAAALLATQWMAPAASAQDSKSPDTAQQIIVDLSSLLYIIGETSARSDEMELAQTNAAAQMQSLLDGIDDAKMVEPDSSGNTPLSQAAAHGYHELVATLLQSKAVRASIDTRDTSGLSAWDHANLSLPRTALICNPSLMQNPFAFIPLMVTMPFYASEPDRYILTRELLARAGATGNSDTARTFWLDKCEYQSESVRQRVTESDDLLEALTAENSDFFNAIFKRLEP